MSKITIEEILELEGLKDKISKLYEEYDNKAKELLNKFGETSVSYPLEKEDEEGHKFIRIKVIDNVKKMQSGGTVYKTASFKAIELDIERLKREPKIKE